MSTPPLPDGNFHVSPVDPGYIAIAPTSLDPPTTLKSSGRHATLSYDLILYILSMIPNSVAIISSPNTFDAQKLESVPETSTPTTSTSTKPTDSNYATLAKCSLVSREFYRAAASLLYRNVVVSPKFNPVLNLREGLAVPASSNLTSALLPHNVAYVLSFEVSGYISPRPGPRNPLPSLIPHALKAFINLQRVVFTPVTYHELLFEEALPVLSTVRRLGEVIVGMACYGGERPGAWGAGEVVKVGVVGVGDERVGKGGDLREGSGVLGRDGAASEEGGLKIPSEAGVERAPLRIIGLVSPGRAILERVPGWLEELKSCGGRLTGLHLKDNCGSVTPGVLRSFLPHIKDSLNSLTLGLSYSLTDEDVFKFVGEIRHLRWLKLRYYWQLKAPPRQPSLPNLHTFIVSHPTLQTREDINELCKWVRRAIKGSPIEVLRLRSDDDPDSDLDVDERSISTYIGDYEWYGGTGYADDETSSYNSPSPGSFDALIEHLVMKHGDKLRILDLGVGFMSVDAFIKVCERCTQLEVLRVTVGKGALDAFITHSSKLTRIHTLDIRVVHVPYYYRYGKSQNLIDWVSKAFSHTPTNLRRIRVQGVMWAASWSGVCADGKMVRRVEEVDCAVLRRPWKR